MVLFNIEIGNGSDKLQILSCWLAGLLACLLAGWLACWLACWLAGLLAGLLASCLVYYQRSLSCFTGPVSAKFQRRCRISRRHILKAGLRLIKQFGASSSITATRIHVVVSNLWKSPRCKENQLFTFIRPSLTRSLISVHSKEDGLMGP